MCSRDGDPQWFKLNSSPRARSGGGHLALVVRRAAGGGQVALFTSTVAQRVRTAAVRGIIIACAAPATDPATQKREDSLPSLADTAGNHSWIQNRGSLSLEPPSPVPGPRHAVLSPLAWQPTWPKYLCPIETRLPSLAGVPRLFSSIPLGPARPSWPEGKGYPLGMK